MKILALVLIALFFTMAAEAATVAASDCTVAAIDAAENTAVDGDTITVPFPSGTCVWTSKLTITKAVTIQSLGGCTLDANGRATSCAGIIQDNTTSGAQGALLDVTCVLGQTTRLTGFQFENYPGNTNSNTNGLITFRCTNASSTRIRIDHNVFSSLRGLPFEFQTPAGVMDHNTIINGPLNTIALHVEHQNWNQATVTPYSYGDYSWTAGVVWGDSTGFYIEDNNITIQDNQRACTDGVTPLPPTVTAALPPVKPVPVNVYGITCPG